MKKILLISSSVTSGSGYLDHCEDALRELLHGRERVLFIPYALRDHDAYTSRARARLFAMGLRLESIHEAADPHARLERCDAIFIGGGNTFRLLCALYDLDLLAAIRARVHSGVPYIGTSAGSNVACPSIKTTNDMPIIAPPSLEALALVPFNINPHYLDADPLSTHMGETRETRIREFHEENEVPVIGLREGAMLRVLDSSLTLLGTSGARLFRRGEIPAELAPGSVLDALLRPAERARRTGRDADPPSGSE